MRLVLTIVRFLSLILLPLTIALALGTLLGVLLVASRLVVSRTVTVTARTLRLRLGLRDLVRSLSRFAHGFLRCSLRDDGLDVKLVELNSGHKRRNHGPVGFWDLGQEQEGLHLIVHGDAVVDDVPKASYNAGQLVLDGFLVRDPRFSNERLEQAPDVGRARCSKLHCKLGPGLRSCHATLRGRICSRGDVNLGFEVVVEDGVNPHEHEPTSLGVELLPSFNTSKLSLGRSRCSRRRFRLVSSDDIPTTDEDEVTFHLGSPVFVAVGRG